MTRKKESLGAALIRKKKDEIKKSRTNRDVYVQEPHVSNEKMPVSSILDMNDLSNLLLEATMSRTRFTAEKNSKTIFLSNAFAPPSRLPADEIASRRRVWNDLAILRMPPWTPGRSPEEQDILEKEAFAQWRQNLALLEEKNENVLSPFELNLQIWKQLWRVIQKSQLVVQVIDARDPLLFRSPDLERYVKEFKERKLNILLMNKADLLSSIQRKYWAKYFYLHGIQIVFFSSRLEQTRLENVKKSNSISQKSSTACDAELEQDSAVDTATTNITNTIDNITNTIDNKQNFTVAKNLLIDNDEKNSALDHEETLNGGMLTGDELLDFFEKYAETELGSRDGIYVGIVGYPNVGKSSLINVLTKKHCVAVSATPGKTKHLQTFQLRKNMILCDCPGLVFPTFMSSRAEMVCTGLVRIAEIREFFGPISIVVRNVPKKELEFIYNINLSDGSNSKCLCEDENLTPQRLLDRYAMRRGFFINFNRPDCSRAARVILNDYVNGKLLFCRSPPNMDQMEYSKYTNYACPELRHTEELPPIATCFNRSLPVAKIDENDKRETDIEIMDLMEFKNQSSGHKTLASNSIRQKHLKVNRRQEKRRQKKIFYAPNHQVEPLTYHTSRPSLAPLPTSIQMKVQKSDNRDDNTSTSKITIKATSK